MRMSSMASVSGELESFRVVLAAILRASWAARVMMLCDDSGGDALRGVGRERYVSYNSDSDSIYLALINSTVAMSISMRCLGFKGGRSFRGWRLQWE